MSVRDDRAWHGAFEMTARILLVEDDPKLASVVREYLTGKGFEVLHEPDGARALERVGTVAPELVILDVLLPGLDGLEICRRIRPAFVGPILMLTALGDDVDEVVGLEIGADDYLVKPVRPRVLVARIRALLRRAAAKGATLAAGGARAISAQLVTGALRIDLTAREARLRDEVVSLTSGEFELLLYLAQRAGQVVRRDDISRDLLGHDWDGMDRTIDIGVTRLRRKLGDDGKNAKVIKSVRGEGYLLAVRT